MWKQLQLIAEIVIFIFLFYFISSKSKQMETVIAAQSKKLVDLTKRLDALEKYITDSQHTPEILNDKIIWEQNSAEDDHTVSLLRSLSTIHEEPEMTRAQSPVADEPVE